MTTADRYTYAFDPSGHELRKALLVKSVNASPTLASLAVGTSAALTLFTGLLRVITS